MPPSPANLPVTSPALQGMVNVVVTHGKLGDLGTVPGMELVIYDTPEAVAKSTARRIADVVNGSAGQSVTLGLAGGSTPRATYEELEYSDLRRPLGSGRCVAQRREMGGSRTPPL